MMQKLRMTAGSVVGTPHRTEETAWRRCECRAAAVPWRVHAGSGCAAVGVPPPASAPLQGSVAHPDRLLGSNQCRDVLPHACDTFNGQTTPDGRGLSRVANIKSQIKRIKTNEKARLRNKAVKSSLKTAIRKFRAAAEVGDAATASTHLQAASRQLDKAASKGVIHANQAANRKSAMAKRVAELAASNSG